MSKWVYTPEPLESPVIKDWILVGVETARYVIAIPVEGSALEFVSQAEFARRNGSRKHSSDTDKTNYNKGIRPDTNYIGDLVEMGGARLFRRSVDYGFKPKGDKYDFYVNGYRINIKGTTMCAPVELLVRVVNSDGVEIEPSQDIYVLGHCVYRYNQCDENGRPDTRAIVNVLGWATRNEVMSAPLKLGRDRDGEPADFWNRAILMKDLHPISELLTMLNISFTPLQRATHV